MSRLVVLSPGMLSLIQDLGRRGVGHLGLSAGGPVDLHAFCWANRLLGNSSGAAALEITLGQASFRAEQDIAVALTGANMSATIDGEPIEHWRSFVLRQGQVLKLGFARRGFRAYLAVAGGIRGADAFGSVATIVRNQMGGLPQAPGRALIKGDVLESAGLRFDFASFQEQWVPSRFIPDYREHIDIGMFETYQNSLFSDEQKQQFYQTDYTLSDKLDRMGIRLQGNAIHPSQNGVISEGIAPGSIQFPPSGQPIILLNDRQTLGGYPKIGCVSKLSLMRLAQARPGTTLRFYRADIADESQKLQQFMRFFSV